MEVKNKTRNTSNTFIFGLISRLISILFPFVIRTIIIYELGSEYVGLTSLFTSVLTILNVSELGISSAIAFCLYKPIANNDKETINALLNLMKKVYKIIGLFILTVGIILTPFIENFINGDYPSNMNIYVLFIIYLLNSAISYLGYAYKGALLEAYQKGALIHKVTAIIEIFKYITQIIVLLLFSNYYLYVMILPISTVLITVFTELKSKKLYPDLYPKGKVSYEIKKIIKNKVIFLSLHSLAATLTNSIDNIVIAGSLGLVATAIYGNYFYIFSAIITILIIAYGAIKPAIGNSLYTKSNKKLNEMFDGIQFLVVWMIAWCSICLLCLYNPFIKIWVGEENQLSNISVVMIVLYFWGNAFKLFFSNTFIGVAGLWNKTLIRQILTALINLVLDVILVNKYGIAGIIFASFFATTVVALPLDIHVTCKYVLKRSTIQELMKVLLYFMFTIIIGAFTYSICRIFSFGGRVEFLLKSILCLIIPNMIIFILFFRTKPFKFIFNRFKSIIANK